MTASGSVAAAGERELIARVAARLGALPDFVRVGLGDDAAVVVPARARLDVVTTDALVEHVHFERGFGSLRDVGYKAVAVNLSDLAAMGAEPRAAVVSIGVPGELPLAEFDALVDGLVEAARGHRLAIVGGNITQSPGGLLVDVTAIGAVHPRSMLLRSGGRAGDALYVSGTVGAAAAGLALLRSRGRTAAEAEADRVPALQAALRRYRRPEPRLRLGMLVGRTRSASAAMDLSDGLADAVRQLAEASGVGARIDAGAIPLDGSVAEMVRDADEGRRVGLTGGEDYELLFAVPRRSRRAFEHVTGRVGLPQVTRLGELTSDRALVVVDGAGVEAELPQGFAHFAESS